MASSVIIVDLSLGDCALTHRFWQCDAVTYQPLDHSKRIGLPMYARTSPMWLGTLRQYLLLVTLLNSVWEVLQLPLYTIWSDGDVASIAVAVLHCTVGDALIAGSCLVLSLLLAGNEEWPYSRFKVIVLITILMGFGYTGYSEWRNTTVTHNWAYTSAMPTLLGIGLAPMAQWLVVPGVVFWWLLRRLRGAS